MTSSGEEKDPFDPDEDEDEDETSRRLDAILKEINRQFLVNKLQRNASNVTPKKKPAFLFIGLTSAGKSSLVNHLLGLPIQMTSQQQYDTCFTIIEFVSHRTFLKLSSKADEPMLTKAEFDSLSERPRTDSKWGRVVFSLDGALTRRRYRNYLPALTSLSEPIAPLTARIIDNSYLQYVPEPLRSLAKNGIFIDSKGIFGANAGGASDTLNDACEFAAALNDCDKAFFLISCQATQYSAEGLNLFASAIAIHRTGRAIGQVKQELRGSGESRGGGFWQNFFSLFSTESRTNEGNPHLGIQAYDKIQFIITRIDQLKPSDINFGFWYEIGCIFQQGLHRVNPPPFHNFRMIFIEELSVPMEGRAHDELVKMNSLPEIVASMLDEEEKCMRCFYTKRVVLIDEMLDCAELQLRQRAEEASWYKRLMSAWLELIHDDWIQKIRAEAKALSSGSCHPPSSKRPRRE